MEELSLPTPNSPERAPGTDSAWVMKSQAEGLRQRMQALTLWHGNFHTTLLMQIPLTILTITGVCLCASCRTATNTTRDAVGGTANMAQRAVTGTVGTVAAAGRTGTGVVRNTTSGGASIVRDTARGDLRGAGRSAVGTVTTTTTGAVRGTSQTGRRAGTTGINTVTDSATTVDDTIRSGGR